MLTTIAALALSLAHTAGPALALPPPCLADADAWPACLGQPQGTPYFTLTDPAAELYRQLDMAGETARDRTARLERLAKGDGAQAIIALTQLGWHAAREGKVRLFHRPYRQALQRPTTDPDLDRYRHLSYATACSRLGEIDCALEHWRQAARTAPAGASWLPEAWAIALWHADARDIAIAWYHVAMINDATLGRGHEVFARTGHDDPMSRLRRALYDAWRQRHATETTTVIVDIDIDAQGRVVRVRLPGDTQLHPALRPRIQTSIASWQFEPLPEQGNSGVLTTTIEVDVRRRAGSDAQTADFEVQHVRMAIQHLDLESRRGLRYPPTASRRRAEGTVILHLLPSDDGTVDQIRIKQSSGHEDLDAAATTAVRDWRFAVPRVDGKALREWITVPISFALTGSAPVHVPLPSYPRNLRQRTSH